MDVPRARRALLGRAAGDHPLSLAPLAELHCHADGLLDAAMLRGLIAEGYDAPVDPDALAGACPVTSVDDWTRRYAAIVAPCLTPARRRLPILAAHVRNLVAQGVAYAELMVSGLLAGDDGATPVERFRAVRATVDRAAAGRARVELLACIGRGPLARAMAQVDAILEVARAGLIVGVAVAGDEGACTIASLRPALARVRDAGLGLEIHAGERGGPESVRDALEHGRPDRIGHGVRAFEDPRLVDEIRRRGVHLELCPTSNLRLGVIGAVEDLPVRRALDLGVSFGINTDDPGPFGCSLRSELALVERAFALGASELATIRAHAWRARFVRDG